MSAWAAGASDGRWRSALQLVGGDGVSSLVGLTANDNAWWRAGSVMAWLILLLIAVGVTRTFYWLRSPAQRANQKVGARLLLAWMLGPLLVLGLSPVTVYPQYWTVLLPLPALFLALGMDACISLVRRLTTPRLASATLVAVASVLAIVWVGSYGATMQALSAGEGGAAFGIPLQRWQETMTAAREWAYRLDVDEIRIASQGVDPGYESDPAVIAALIGNPPYARFVAPGSPPALLLKDGKESLYLWTIDAPETERLLAELGTKVWEGTLANGRPPARLYRLPSAEQSGLDYLPLAPAPVFAAGMELLGYDIPADAAANTPFDVTLVWRVLDPPPAVRAGDYTAFNHILAADTGARVAQADGLDLLSRDWWPGDVLVQPYRVQLPAGEYIWRVGLYSRVDGTRSSVSTGGDAVELRMKVSGIVFQSRHALSLPRRYGMMTRSSFSHFIPFPESPLMTKQSRAQRKNRRVRQPNVPPYTGPIAPAAADANSAVVTTKSAPSASAPSRVGSTTPAGKDIDWAAEYGYVGSDLRQTAIFAAAMLALLLILNYVI